MLYLLEIHPYRWVILDLSSELDNNLEENKNRPRTFSLLLLFSLLFHFFLLRASALRAEFEWIEPPTRSDVLNEVYICTKLTSDSTPCEISTHLLVRLKEVLKTYSSSPAGEKYTKKAGTNLIKVILVCSCSCFDFCLIFVRSLKYPLTPYRIFKIYLLSKSLN
jgi:hypothetical protein